MRFAAIAFLLCTVFVSSNFSQWSQSISGMGNQVIGSLLADGDSLYAASTFDLFKSTNQGDEWFT